ncbi:MAG: molybdenum cofactor guanylyltransferase [Colwellia sp.]|nr:molybdenum cofactor guanylyltransferase [Colwellia sp.]MCW8864031.1 molybdenum cofactor guanylyltransferase [Colwellia sp.]MCW9083010.1 molybdenum cofactor guanylyltransferase [Colwellia sp.]
MIASTNDCLGVVLAGGLSSRMGQDKAQLQRKNDSMLEFSKQVLSDSGVNNIVVSGDNYDVPDQVKQSGPVGGILSVLASYPQVKSLLILPVDLPFITASALTELRAKGEVSQKATYFSGHNIPLYLPNNAYVELFLAQAFATSHSKTSNNEASRFNNKGPSIKALLKQVPHQAITCSHAQLLFNTNTPDEWQQARAELNL